MLKCGEDISLDIAIAYEQLSATLDIDPNPLKNQLDGRLVSQSDGFEYDLSRALWNGALNIRPWAVVQPQSLADLQKCLRFASETNVKIIFI